MDTPEITVPDGYRIHKMGKDWYIPEKWDEQRSMWRHFDKGAGQDYYSHKTWKGAFNFIQRKEEARLARLDDVLCLECGELCHLSDDGKRWLCRDERHN